MRVLRRLRRGLPHRHLARKIHHRARPTRAQPDHHLRLLRCGLRLQSRNEGQHRGSHGALERWQGQRRSLLRERSFCVGLRHPPRPHHQADDPRQDHRPLARGQLGRSHQPRSLGVQAYPSQTRQGFCGRHHLLTLHQRRNLLGSKVGTCRLWHQQRGHLRPCVSLTHRLWFGSNLWYVCGYTNLQIG